MVPFLIIAVIAIIFTMYNMLKDRTVLSIISGILGIIGICIVAYIACIYSGRGYIGTEVMTIVELIIFNILILAIIFKIVFVVKYNLKERTILIALMIIIAFIMYCFSLTTSFGTPYFATEEQILAYEARMNSENNTFNIIYMILVAIQINLFIYFIKQKKSISESDKEKKLEEEK